MIKRNLSREKQKWQKRNDRNLSKPTMYAQQMYEFKVK